jgi:hypothetical protein
MLDKDVIVVLNFGFMAFKKTKAICLFLVLDLQFLQMQSSP